MHSDGMRRNGGIGFSISDPKSVLEVSLSPSYLFEDSRALPWTNDEASSLADVISAAIDGQGLKFTVSIRLSGGLRSHVGLGSGTAIRLAAMEALFLLNNRQVRPEQLVEWSKRGGTSGIGVNTYFSGGLILDVGTPNGAEGFHPSSAGVVTAPPLCLPPLAMPLWKLCVCIPTSLVPKTQAQESEFFVRTAPLSPESSYRTAYDALFGVYASVAEADYKSFCSAVNALQQSEWKRMEWQEYGAPIALLAENLRELGADCVGLSSLGPLVFCFGDEQALSDISKSQAKLRCAVHCAIPDNSGRKILPG